MSFVVAIDGPAGSGKGTVTKKVAEKTGLINIDTGVTYRAITLAAIRKKYKIEEEDKIASLLNEIKIEFKKIGEKEVYFLNGENVTEEIRSKAVNEMVSPVSGIREVRINMAEFQRRLGRNKNIVMEGRDIGTYVFPNADIKIYLDASVEERARRRHKEIQEKNNDMTYEEVLENIKKRDYNDMHKDLGALKIAEDATIIDTTNLAISEVVDKIKIIILGDDRYRKLKR